MNLTNKAAGVIVTGLAGLLLTVTNPNCEFRDIKDPLAGITKSKSDLGYENSGIIYNIGYAGIVGSLIGLGYLVLTGNFRKRE